MNDIKLEISKSRGYENVDLEEMCNKKTPQDGEQKNTPKGVKVWQCRCEKCKYDKEEIK